MPRPSANSSASTSGTNLRYVNAHDPGIARVRRGKAFAYVGVKKRAVADKATLARIAALAIPPAWKDVWICADPRGHLQATGIDARGRKQYRYHTEWTAHRNQAKFHHLSSFARVLPRVRTRISKDLAASGLPKQKILACIVHLLDTSHIRIGNEEYARDNHSYGLTTIRRNHALVRGADIRLTFRAKSGKACDVRLHDSAAAAVLRRCQCLSGQVLFEYLGADERPRPVTSCDVNDYLHEITGLHVTAKDFRTWGGTTIAAGILLDSPLPPPLAHLKRAESAAIRAAATALNNTISVCRKFYVHPRLMTAHASGALGRAYAAAKTAHTPRHLHAVERAVARLLDTRVLDSEASATAK